MSDRKRRIVVCADCGQTRRNQARGLCIACYRRHQYHGTIERFSTILTVDRFWASVSENSCTGCSDWRGTVGSHGYGQFGDRGRHFLAHRWSYEYLVGPIPAGLHLDHLCRNRICINPEHLEPVTQAENNRRSLVARGYGS